MGSDVELEQWQSVHPASLFVNLLPRFYRTLRGAWPLLLAVLVGDRTDGWQVFDLALVIWFFLGTVGSTVVHFFTLRFRVERGRLEIKTGLLQRRVRTIDPARIQNVELVRNPLHTLTGLVEVRLETASGREVEGLLSALEVPRAEALVVALQAARAEVEAPSDEQAPALLQLGIPDLFRYGVTTLRPGAVAIVVGVLAELLQLADPADSELLSRVLVGTALMPVLLLAAITGNWLWGTLNAVIRHFNFKLHEDRGRLVVTEGLLTRRRVEVPAGKVQLVRVLEPMLRRWAGFSSVRVETAAGASGSGGTERREAVIPVVYPQQLAAVLQKVVTGLDVDLQQVELLPPHPRALWRSTVGGVARASIIAGLASWLLWPVGLVVWVLVPIAVAAARLDYAYQGWRVTDALVISRRGWWNRRTEVAARHKLQSVEYTQGPLLRRHGLAQLVVRVAGSTVALPVLGWDQAEKLRDELSSIPRPPALLAEHLETLAPQLEHDHDHAHQHAERDRGGEYGGEQATGEHQAPKAPAAPEQVADGHHDLGEPEGEQQHTAATEGEQLDALGAVEAVLPDPPAPSEQERIRAGSGEQRSEEEVKHTEEEPSHPSGLSTDDPTC